MTSSSHNPAMYDTNDYIPMRFNPSPSASIAAIVVFTLTTLLHVFQLLRKRTWYLTPLIIGGLIEILGYMGRTLQHNHIWARGPLVVQTLLILIAPAFFTASIYIVFGRITQIVDGDNYLLVSKKWLVKIFVSTDALSFILQAIGAGISTERSYHSLHTGQHIVIAGLFIHLISFIIFTLVAATFHHRLLNDKPVLLRSKSTQQIMDMTPSMLLNELPFKRHMSNIYFVNLLILVRGVVKVVEYFQGNSGVLLKHEIFFYGFDAFLMMILMVTFNIIHPSGITAEHKKGKSDVEAAESQRSQDVSPTLDDK